MSDRLFYKCVVCSDDIPEGRYNTCSHDCHTIWVVDCWRGERRYRKFKAIHNREPGYVPQKFNAKLKIVQGTSKGKHKRNCDYCKHEFLASNTKQYYCTPQCAILSGKINKEYPQRRQPSMPKMLW